MNDDELKELKEETTMGKRTDAAAEGQPAELHEDIVEELRAIDQSGKKTIAVRDESLTALLGAPRRRPGGRRQPTGCGCWSRRGRSDEECAG